MTSPDSGIDFVSVNQSLIKDKKCATEDVEVGGVTKDHGHTSENLRLLTPTV